MKIGVVYPQTEYDNDPTAIRDYAQAVEALGFTHVLAYEHVLGANPQRRGGWSGPYTHEHPFLSPLLLFSFMAAATRTLEFTTGVVILPQRQTALFAKQAATLDVLSGGRTRLGVGLGWNPIEYIALNQDFHTRGQRIEEQVALLRLLWTRPLVEFSGRWHNIPDAGINPLPLQRPIPIWFGGSAEAVLRRAARMADGWMPTYRRAADALASLELIEGLLAEAGRSRAGFGVEARLHYGDGDASAWSEALREWEQAGATHVSFNTMGHGFETPGQHLAAIRLFADAVGLG
ncbi:MAG: LLM class F420-dependent oxidoreductase [Anaerolineales bacterium]|nr:LLM class F420-dependent oxidoreductase [Anaerolineales bacterium]